MIQYLLEEDFIAFHKALVIVAIMWGLVAIAIAIDLASGVRKAKQRGELSTSYGFRQTVNKAVLYYAFMLFAFMFDCIGMFFYSIPALTLIGAAFLIFIECKSVLEKAHDKDKRKLNKSLKDLSILLDNRDDLIRGLNEMLKKQLQDEETKPE